MAAPRKENVKEIVLDATAALLKTNTFADLSLAQIAKAAGVSKLPNIAALQAEYEKLQAQKEALYADYGKLKKQIREYDVIKQNIDSILRQEKEPEREKRKERGE